MNLLLLPVLAALAAAEGGSSLPGTPARFVPGGAAGQQRLLGDDCADCHADIAAQWAQSAHRFASFNNPYYAVSVTLLHKERPPQAARLCAGCHDPLLLATDAVSELGFSRTTPAAQAGLVCLTCHSLHANRQAGSAGETDHRGNGGYTLLLDPVPAAQRGATGDHSARLRPAAMAQSDFCAPCHKVGLPGELTLDGWFRGQNEYDAWQSSVAGGQGVAAVYRDGVTPRRCQDCHMPLTPGAGGRMVRSHRFLAANTALPHWRGDTDMEARTAEFLRGAVSLDLLVQPPGGAGTTAEQVGVGTRGEVVLDVVLRNRRVGHRFPGGTADSNEARVVVEVYAPPDEGGALLLRDDRHVLRPQPVDEEARPLERRDVQHFRGVVYDTSLGPADPQVTRYRLDLALLPQRTRAVEVRASLRYRKFSAAYAALACAELAPGPAQERCMDPPVVEMASARRVLILGGAAPPDAAPQASADAAQWQRFLDHGLGLADGVVDRTGDALPSLQRAAALAPGRAEPQLGLARLHLAQGRTADVLAACARAETLRPEHPAALWLRAQAYYRTYRWAEARPPLERLFALLPQDRNVLALLARVRGLTADPSGALQAADALLVLDSESEDGHYQRMLALRELGRAREAEEAEGRYLTFRRRVEQEQRLRDRFRQRYPLLANEDAPAHLHDLTKP